jgi:hypothetical protein
LGGLIEHIAFGVTEELEGGLSRAQFPRQIWKRRDVLTVAVDAVELFATNLQFCEHTGFLDPRQLAPQICQVSELLRAASRLEEGN